MIEKTIQELEYSDARTLDELAALIRGTRGHCERMERLGRVAEAKESVERRQKLAKQALSVVINYI